MKKTTLFEVLRDVFKKDSHIRFPKISFLSNFFQLLTMNIHPFHSKRLKIEENILLFKDLLKNTQRIEFLKLIDYIFTPFLN